MKRKRRESVAVLVERLRAACLEGDVRVVPVGVSVECRADRMFAVESKPSAFQVTLTVRVESRARTERTVRDLIALVHPPQRYRSAPRARAKIKR